MPRTSPLNRKMQWREWSGYFASSVYADAHDIEYNAIREAAALIDVSPALQVPRRRAGRPPPGRPGHHPRRDQARGRRASSTRPGATSTARSSTTARSTASTSGCYRWTAADPQLRWLRQNSAGLDVTITEESESTAALALQGPALAGRPRGRDRRVVRGPALLPAARLEDRQGRHRRVADRLHGRSRLRAVDPGTRTRSRSGTRSSRPGATTASGRPGCWRSTSSGSRRASSSSRSTTRPRATR